MTSPQTNGLPVELSRYEFERLYAFVYDTMRVAKIIGRWFWGGGLTGTFLSPG